MDKSDVENILADADRFSHLSAADLETELGGYQSYDIPGEPLKLVFTYRPHQGVVAVQGISAVPKRGRFDPVEGVMLELGGVFGVQCSERDMARRRLSVVSAYGGHESSLLFSFGPTQVTTTWYRAPGLVVEGIEAMHHTAGELHQRLRGYIVPPHAHLTFLHPREDEEWFCFSGILVRGLDIPPDQDTFQKHIQRLGDRLRIDFPVEQQYYCAGECYAPGTYTPKGLECAIWINGDTCSLQLPEYRIPKEKRLAFAHSVLNKLV